MSYIAKSKSPVVTISNYNGTMKTRNTTPIKTGTKPIQQIARSTDIITCSRSNSESPSNEKRLIGDEISTLSVMDSKSPPLSPNKVDNDYNNKVVEDYNKKVDEKKVDEKKVDDYNKKVIEEKKVDNDYNKKVIEEKKVVDDYNKKVVDDYNKKVDNEDCEDNGEESGVIYYVVGPKGDDGKSVVGQRGLQGDQGETGERGPRGEAGKSIIIRSEVFEPQFVAPPGIVIKEISSIMTEIEKVVQVSFSATINGETLVKTAPQSNILEFTMKLPVKSPKYSVLGSVTGTYLVESPSRFGSLMGYLSSRDTGGPGTITGFICRHPTEPLNAIINIDLGHKLSTTTVYHISSTFTYITEA